MRYICLQYCKVYYLCHLFQICLNVRFSNYHYILCRNNLDNTYIRNIKKSRLVSHGQRLRILTKSKHIKLLWFVHIMHHNSLLCITTKTSSFIWFSHMNMFCTLIFNIIGSHYISMLLDSHIWDTLRSPKYLIKWGVHILGCPLWPLSFIRHDCQWH